MRDELASAYGQQPWPSGRIDRLAQDLAKTELAIAAISAPAARALAPTLSSIIGRATARTPLVARNRLTPFGQRVSEPSGE